MHVYTHARVCAYRHRQTHTHTDTYTHTQRICQFIPLRGTIQWWQSLWLVVYWKHCLHCKMPCFIFLTQLTNLPGYSDHSCTQSWSSPLPLGSGNYTTPKLLLLFLLQLSHMTIWGSILSWFVFLPIYAQVWYVYITTYSTPKILHIPLYTGQHSLLDQRWQGL